MDINIFKGRVSCISLGNTQQQSKKPRKYFDLEKILID